MPRPKKTKGEHRDVRPFRLVLLLIFVIQSVGVTRGRNGFRKDKGGEKLLETEEDLLQHRTDGTDAFDTLYIGCQKFPFHDHLSLFMGGVL